MGTLNNHTYPLLFQQINKPYPGWVEVSSLLVHGIGQWHDFRSPTSGCGVHFWHHASGASSSGNGKHFLGSSYNMDICLVGSHWEVLNSFVNGKEAGRKQCVLAILGTIFSDSFQMLSAGLQDAWVHQMLMGGGKTCVTSWRNNDSVAGWCRSWIDRKNLDRLLLIWGGRPHHSSVIVNVIPAWMFAVFAWSWYLHGIVTGKEHPRTRRYSPRQAHSSFCGYCSVMPTRLNTSLQWSISSLTVELTLGN